MNEENEELVNETEQEQHALVLKQQVGALVVCDKESFARMESIEKTAKDNIKALKTHLDVAIKEAHAKHKKLTSLLNRITAPFATVAQDARSKCSEWARKERERAKALQREQEAVLAKVAEEERLRQAEALEKAGNSEMAEAVLESPMPVPIAFPKIEVPKVKGERVIWYAEIVDLKKMFAAYGSGKTPIPELDAKQKAQLVAVLGLNGIATGLKSNLSIMLDGVEGRKRYSK